MQTSKAAKRILVIVLTLLLIAGGIFSMKLCLSPASATELFNHYVGELQENGENVDLVFVGASRVYYGFDPDIFEEELGIDNALNDATPAQRTVLTYYMLKDMTEKFHPKYVVMGTTYNGLMFRQGLRNFTLAMDRLALPNRLACASKVFGLKEGLMILTGKSEYLNDENFDIWYSNATKKINRGQGINDTKSPKYNENGYIESYDSMPQGGIDYGFDLSRYFAEGEIDDTSLEYLMKSIQLCKDNDIEMILISGMCTSARMYSVTNYQGVTDYFTKLAEDNGIKYFNMNYLKDRESLFPDTSFIDDQHLNYEGGQLQSKIFAKIFKEYLAGEDTDHYFYRNFDEMTADMHRIPGCAAQITDYGQKMVVDARSVHNDEVVPQYRLLGCYSKEGEDEVEIIADWTTEHCFTEEKDSIIKYDYLKVEAKSGETGETYAFKNLSLKKFKK